MPAAFCAAPYLLSPPAPRLPAALRGEFDPPAWKDNTERTPGLLLDSLMQFPGQYTFSLVLKAQGVPQEQVLAEVAALVAR